MNITIRNVPDSVRDELADRAARSGRSMQEYLVRELVALAGRPNAADAIARARANAETLPSLDFNKVLEALRVSRQ